MAETPGRVTVAIPVYKRLELLPNALASVRAQDYPEIDLLVSDNGCNGSRVLDLVAAHYDQPFRFRQNVQTVPVVKHFNQLIDAASGEYFVLLCDDDEISPDFLSEQVALMEDCPEADLCFSRREVLDEEGDLLPDDGPRPSILEGYEFLRLWSQYRYNFRQASMVTCLFRTAAGRAIGGYPDFPRALYSDEALILRLAANRKVVLAQHGAFRWRRDNDSFGHRSSYREMAEACRQYERFLWTDPYLRARGRENPRDWARTWWRLLWVACDFYFHMWASVYARELNTREWLRAGFALPFHPRYYGLVVRALCYTSLTAILPSAQGAIH